jgi:hypothetical protein
MTTETRNRARRVLLLNGARASGSKAGRAFRIVTVVVCITLYASLLHPSLGAASSNGSGQPAGNISLEASLDTGIHHSVALRGDGPMAQEDLQLSTSSVGS